MMLGTPHTSSLWEEAERINFPLNWLQSGVRITSIRLIWSLVKLCIIGVQRIVSSVREITGDISRTSQTSIISFRVDFNVGCQFEDYVKLQSAMAMKTKLMWHLSSSKKILWNFTYLQHRRWYHQPLWARWHLNQTTIDRHHLGWD